MIRFSPYQVRFVVCSVCAMKLNNFLVIFVGISVIFADASETTTRRPFSCGRRPAGGGNVYGGNHTRFNSWPWLVVLRFKPTNAFFCGGSLITERHIVSGSINQRKIAIAISFYSFQHHTVSKTSKEQKKT
jgi:secreted trypsin-like serine protease